MGGAMLSKSLIQFSVEWRGYVPFLLFYLRPNNGRGNENNEGLLQKVPCSHCYIQCLQPCSRPLPNHASTGDTWTLMDTSWTVSCGVRCAQVSVCALPKSVSPVLWKFCWLYGGLIATSSKRVYTIPKSTSPKAPAPAAVHCWSLSPQETPKHSSVSKLFCFVLFCFVLFEPPEHLQRVWGLIPNAILPLLQSCWGFSFDLGCGVSPQSLSNATQLLP